jgi:fimbrial chaperone protein
MSSFLRAFGFLVIALSTGSPAFSGPFEIAASPSRFEISGKSGVRIGQSLDIYNVGKLPAEVALRTLDWSYSADGNISYHDELQPNSCRPWVALERKTVVVNPSSKRIFRFQLDIPSDAPRGECRFMIAIEGIEPAYRALLESGGASLSLPVNGRLAIAVYVSISGAESKLALTHIGMSEFKGKRTPTVTVTNTGDAHGRLEGNLDAIDTKGVAFELIPEGTPVMPGQTRVLPLIVKSEAKKVVVEPVYPVKAQGIFDWENGSFKVDVEFK